MFTLALLLALPGPVRPLPAALPAPATLPATLPGPQTADVVVTRPVAAAPLDARTERLLSHPDGGVIAVSGVGAATGSLIGASLRVQRIDENGDVLWSNDITGTGGFGPVHVAILPDGSAVLGTTNAGSFSFPTRRELVRLDTSGAVAWRTELAPGGPALLSIEHVGVSSSGDVLVGGPKRIGFGPTSAVALSVAEATGDVQWTLERPNVARVTFRAAGGDAYLGYNTSNFQARLERLDASGNVLYARDEPVEFQGTIKALDADANGNALVRVSWLGGDPMMRFDPSGGMVWSNRFLAAGDPVDVSGTITADGGALVAVGNAGSGTTPRVARLEPNGTRTWYLPVAAVTFPAQPVVFEAAPGLVAVPGAFTDALSTDVRPGVEFLDLATGATVETLLVEGAPSPLGGAALEDALLDGRGSLWLAGRTTVGARVEGRVLRAVLDGELGVVLCTQTTANSTGVVSKLRAAGPVEVASDNVTLVAYDLPPFAVVLFLNAPQGSFVPNPNGSRGTLCLGGTIGRYALPNQIRVADSAGSASLQLDLPLTPRGAVLVPVIAGSTVHFQAWHRDVFGGQNTSNFTNSIRVEFE